MVELKEIPVIRGADIILRGLNQKLTVGSKLTQLEIMMGMSADATNASLRYGPGPRDMQPASMPLPEHLRGAIASAKG